MASAGQVCFTTLAMASPWPMPRGRSALLLGVLLAGCSGEGPAALVLRLSSDLTIGQETNSLVVRVRADEGAPEEASYPLGEGERAAWPQTLPIVAGARHPKEVSVELELRWATPGVPSVVVGYAELTHAFPERQSQEVAVSIARACTDADGDGYGVGFGCDKPDCDDRDPAVPAQRFCGAPVPTDGGVADSGVPDGGDAGVQPDAGAPELCGVETCEGDEVCFMDECRQSCTDNRDCDGVQLACLQVYGICICRVPCLDSNTCGPFQCVDGCCQLPF